MFDNLNSQNQNQSGENKERSDFSVPQNQSNQASPAEQGGTGQNQGNFADKQKADNTAMPRADKSQIEDIFADTEKGRGPAPLPGENNKNDFSDQDATLMKNETKEGGGNKKKFFIIAGIVVFLAVFIFAGLLLANSLLDRASQDLDNQAETGQEQNQAQEEENEQNQANLEEEEENETQNNTGNNEEPIDAQEEIILDTDKDGLTDEEEMILGTDIDNPDSDFDDLYDKDEVELYNSDPLNKDTDDDGYLDGFEVKNGYSPTGPGKIKVIPEINADGEFRIDTDGDGLYDDEEDSYGTSSENKDTDGDGLSDYDEVKIYQTDPLDADSDKDGYSDGEEVQNGYNPAGPGKLNP